MDRQPAGLASPIGAPRAPIAEPSQSGSGQTAGRLHDDAFYRALVEGMNEGVLARDADGIITYVSPQYRTGRSRDWPTLTPAPYNAC